MSSKENLASSVCQGSQDRCALCHDHLRAAHTHPGQWASNVQQFLLQYSDIPLSSCVCKADEVSVRNGLAGKYRGKFTPRWVKRQKHKQKPSCCVPGCGITAERNCTFASFDTICAAFDVSIDEPGSAAASSSLPLCTRHYHGVYKHCNPDTDVECALCGSKRKHRVNSKLPWSFRPIPQPENIHVLLEDAGNFDGVLTADSLACNKCYLLCQRLLQQCDEDIRSPESIVQAVRVVVDELQDRLQRCTTTSDYNGVALLHTAKFLGEHMLSDQAITFPQLYQKYSEYLKTGVTSAVPLLPKYKVFVYVGKEFGDLMSSVCPRKRCGRILYRTKCDPFMMLSYALGTAKTERAEPVTNLLPVEPVADYLNEKVRELATHLIQESDQAPVAASTFDLEAFTDHVHPDLWTMVTRLTQSASERLGRKKSAAHVYEKKLRNAYLVCMLTFCASGGRCSDPLHTQLTDYVDASGGSSEVISLMNELGAVASSDTLDRHIVRVSAQRKQEGLLKGLDSQRFTISTTDNADILKSHATVYCGSQHRSWHGTTVQVVQPQRRLKVIVRQVNPDVSRMDMSSPCPTNAALPPSDISTNVSTEHPVALSMPQCQYAQDSHNSHIRRQRTSPVSSPSRQTRSPAPKRHRTRARTFPEAVSLGEVSESVFSNAEVLQVGSRQASSMGCLQLKDFLQTAEEVADLEKIKKKFFSYVLCKSAVKPEHVLIPFKDHLAAVEGESIHAEPAVVVYLSIVDMNADTMEAMAEVAAMLYKEYILSTGAEHLVVAGDAKTYLRLKELKQQYGSELAWLLPFVGDWHVLYNYQKVLMKVYFAAGLKVLAMVSGFRGETLTSLASASNFKRTHAFLMEVWEAFCLYFVDQYLLHSTSDLVPNRDTLLANVRARLILCNTNCIENCSFSEYSQLIGAVEAEFETVFSDFVAFVDDLAGRDDTWKFWSEFVFHDCLAYVGLYLAIRGGSWSLRMASLKEMCPLFTAFDRVNYLKILPQHFAEIMCLPENIRHCLEDGGFVVNIRGSKMHAVALDEAHETLINKDLKTSVVRPSKEYLDKMMYYFPVRARRIKQLKEQIFPFTTTQDKTVSVFDGTPHAARCEENVETIKSKLCDSHVLDVPEKNGGLLALDGTAASPEQQRDMMAFRSIGQQYYSAYIQYFILREPTAKAPLHLRRLVTFSARKKAQKKIKQKEREQKLVSQCIRRQLAWSARTQSSEHKGTQYLELPRAICSPSGMPHKGQKSFVTKFLEKRYSSIVVNVFPGGWVPDSVVMEGMFLINTSPLVTHSTMKDYALFLVRRFAVPHFAKGVREVHVVFDSPGLNLRTPKAFEQSRRDSEHTVLPDHEHYQFSDEAGVPQKWRDCLNCRHCKRQLVLYLGTAFVTHASQLMTSDQKLVTAGCFEGGKALGITVSGVEVCSLLACDAEEADTRVWLHVVGSVGTKKLLLSPDTDVYHVGLSLLNPDRYDVYVQLSPVASLELRLLHLNQLLQSLDGDPDLAFVPPGLRPCVLQTLYICSGCDYISFFAGFGKVTIMKHFFANAWFVTGSQDISGTLADTSPERLEQGFLSFVRLVGTVYFKKHLAQFTVDTPRALYMSLTQIGVDHMQQHKKFLEAIRETVWSRIQFEDDFPPSFDALWRHWLRTCWVSNMWSQATQNHMNLHDLTQYGWKVVEGRLECDWESEENRAVIRERVGLLFRGCSCSSVTACSTRRCSCVKRGSKCGPGCRCKNCGNSCNAATGTQQSTPVESHEVEQEELLHDTQLRMHYGEECASESDEDPSLTEEEDDPDEGQGEVDEDL